jgi:hypothetical protein
MKRARVPSPARLLAPFLFLLISACGAGESEPVMPEVDASLVGERVEMVMADGRTTQGVAVLVTQSDGTTRAGIFRGPRPLADAASEGTWTFREDALHARVHLLGPEETLRRREG